MPKDAIRVGYTYEEGSTAAMWYTITVHNPYGEPDAVITKKTFQEARAEFERLGFRYTGPGGYGRPG